MSNDDIVVCDYYNLNNNGFGALYRMPLHPPAGTPAFYSAFNAPQAFHFAKKAGRRSQTNA